VFQERARSWALAPLSLLFCVIVTSAPSSATTIHSGDSLYVKVWNHPELSKQVVVDADGDVRVPLSGVVAVAGLDESSAAKKLAYALRPYVVYPAVNIETIEQSKTLFVAGGPIGQLPYKPGETLTGAVADAMNSTPNTTQSLNATGASVSRDSSAYAAMRARIDLRNVGIERDGTSIGAFDTVALTAHADPGPALEPGDTIVFAYKPVEVRVLGDVADPGATYLAKDQSVAEAITQAGGLLPTAVTNHLLLTRDGVTRSLALGDPAFAAPAQTGDIVDVPEAPRVNVIGTVATPGVVTLRTDPSLLSAMYTAGGPTKYANIKDVQILRDGQKTSYDVTQLTHGDTSQNPVLKDGDTVVVPEGHYFDFTGVFGVLGGIAAGLASRI